MGGHLIFELSRGWGRKSSLRKGLALGFWKRKWIYPGKHMGKGDIGIFCRPVLEQEARPTLEVWNGPVTPGPWFKPQPPNALATG